MVGVKSNIYFSKAIVGYTYLDRSPAILTSDDFIRSNEIVGTKWSTY